MEVFVRLNDFDLYTEDITPDEAKSVPDDILKELFNAIKMEYEEAANDKEAYLVDCFSDKNFLFGLTEPEKLTERALAWNGEIKKALYDSMAAVLDEAEANAKRDGLGIVNGLVLDTQKTYALSDAAREADNRWYAYAGHAVLFPNSSGYTYFQTIIPDAYLEDIKANPQDYVVVTVYPK